MITMLYIYIQMFVSPHFTLLNTTGNKIQSGSIDAVTQLETQINRMFMLLSKVCHTVTDRRSYAWASARGTDHLTPSKLDISRPSNRRRMSMEVSKIRQTRALFEKSSFTITKSICSIT